LSRIRVLIWSLFSETWHVNQIIILKMAKYKKIGIQYPPLFIC